MSGQESELMRMNRILLMLLIVVMCLPRS